MPVETAADSEDQARELRRAVAPGMLWSACMYCGKYLGTKPCLPEAEGRVSHGICPACMEIHHPQVKVD